MRQWSISSRVATAVLVVLVVMDVVLVAAVQRVVQRRGLLNQPR
jgi:hypothetical protein